MCFFNILLDSACIDSVSPYTAAHDERATIARPALQIAGSYYAVRFTPLQQKVTG